MPVRDPPPESHPTDIYSPLRADNHFAWLGLSAMAGWGYTNEMDGTDGQQPRYTSIERNYVREIGIIEKQSSLWFQAKTCLTNLDSNVGFNQPRAAIKCVLSSVNCVVGVSSTSDRVLTFVQL